MANDVAETLDKARALIEKGWTQGASARGKSKRQVELNSPSAVCFCASGAINRAAPRFGGVYAAASEALKRAIGQRFIVAWNDAEGRTQAEVIQAFKEAAALARAGAL